MAGVARCASEIDEGTIVTVSPDGGWKYLSTDVWTGALDDVVERARHELYF
jgi:predicted Zn-dependent protease